MHFISYNSFYPHPVRYILAQQTLKRAITDYGKSVEFLLLQEEREGGRPDG